MSTELSKSDYSLEDEYGWVLDGVEKYVEDNLDDFLEHVGVKGMHWGVRKSEGTKTPLTGLGPDKIERVTKSGDKITLTKTPPNAIIKGLARISSKYRDAYNNGVCLKVTDKHGKHVGDANIYKQNGDELYINWIGVKKSARGNGYGAAIMKAAEDFGSKSGMKKMTLEVPGNSPDARHIYEKMGFKVVKEGDPRTDPYWGGLTSMEYTFDTAKHYAEVGEDFLAHYGIAGMKWGVRNRSDDNSRDANTRENTLRDHTPRQGMSRKKKIAIGIGGAVLVTGLAAATFMLAKNGHSVPKQGISKNGHKAVKAFDKTVWDKQVKDFDSLISTAHQEQTAYMRKAIREQGGQYVVQDNPFTPEARKAIGR